MNVLASHVLVQQSWPATRACNCKLPDTQHLSCIAGKLTSPPQWGVRGGGGRNRGIGGRFKGLDPVVPVTDSEILSSISDFYGIAQDFPLWDQLITRYLFPPIFSSSPSFSSPACRPLFSISLGDSSYSLCLHTVLPMHLDSIQCVLELQTTWNYKLPTLYCTMLQCFCRTSCKQGTAARHTLLMMYNFPVHHPWVECSAFWHSLEAPWKGPHQQTSTSL